MRNVESMSSYVFHTLLVSDVESLVLIRQCHFIESVYDTNFTSFVLFSLKKVSLSQLKDDIISKDYRLLLLLSESNSYPARCLVSSVAVSSNSS